MPKTEYQNKIIREEKSAKIKEAALDLFAEYTYHNTSVQQIASKAGVSKGLLYNYFESKEELLKSLITDFIKEGLEFFDTNHDGVLTDDEFLIYLSKSFEMVEKKPRHWKLYLNLTMQSGVINVVEDIAVEESGSIVKTLYEFFKNKNYKDPEAEMFFFSSLIKGTIIQYLSSPEQVPINKIKNFIIDFYKQKFS